ncbi:MAG: hypothetical protein ACKVVP_24025 [Chloroflexota bacterium]
MAKELQPMDVTNIPDLLRLAEEVRETQTPRVLTQGDDEIAVLSPVVPSRTRARRAKPIPRTDSLFNIVGLAHSDGPTDVSENVDKYLAEAVYAKSHPPTEK